MVERLRRSGDDRIVDMMRSLALRSGQSVVMATLGDVKGEDPLTTEFKRLVPESLSVQFASVLDAVVLCEYADDAESTFAAAADAVAVFAGTVGTGVQALHVHRDGIVEIALPNSGVQTIRSTPFPGFSEQAA